MFGGYTISTPPNNPLYPCPASIVTKVVTLEMKSHWQYTHLKYNKSLLWSKKRNFKYARAKR